jgi:hypothetical protein
MGDASTTNGPALASEDDMRDTLTANVPVLAHRPNGAPLLPAIDLTAYSLDVIVKLLKEFMTAAWSMSRFHSSLLVLTKCL